MLSYVTISIFSNCNQKCTVEIEINSDCLRVKFNFGQKTNSNVKKKKSCRTKSVDLGKKIQRTCLVRGKAIPRVYVVGKKTILVESTTEKHKMSRYPLITMCSR